VKGISVIIVLLFFSLAMIFFIFESRQKKIIAQKKITLNLMIDDSKHRYKLDVENLCEELFLSRVHRDKLYLIANNWFVYQSINEEHVDSLTITLKRLSLHYGALVAYFTENNENIDFVQERVNNFVNNLPKGSNGFNADFYTSKIEQLSKLLEIPHQENTDINQELPFAQSSVSTDFTDNSELDTSSYQSDSYNVVETSNETPKPSVEVEHENQKEAVI